MPIDYLTTIYWRREEYECQQEYEELFRRRVKQLIYYDFSSLSYFFNICFLSNRRENFEKR
ncbi:MAG: hypothetical protein QXG91_00870 [Candidatus Aenigmatarchaeota archaeon]